MWKDRWKFYNPEAAKVIEGDHIGGGGNKHKKELKARGSGFYLWLVREDFPEGFRTLCHNCNQSFGAYGYCPHEKERANGS